MSSTNTFDRYAREYDATVQAAIGASGETVAYFAELKARLARATAPVDSSRLLDFGCGVGNMSRALVASFPGAAIVGADSSAESIEAARARVPSAAFVHLPSDRLPFDDDAFDVVVAACVFHHIDPGKRVHWVREIVRVLAPNGRFMLFEHNPLNPLTRQVVRRVPFDAGVRLIAARDARRLVKAGGLRRQRGSYYFFFPRALSALRPLEPALGWLPLGAQYLIVGER